MSLRVMVPLDGSAFAEQAIPHATDLVAHGRGELHLVKVHQPSLEPGMGDAMYLSAEALDEDAREEDRVYLERIAKSPTVAELRPFTALLTGDVVPALNEYVHSCDINLIVMSTHGRTGLSRAWLGSVAESLLKATHIPTLLLKPSNPDADMSFAIVDAPRHILIPVDETVFSESVIKTALALGDRERTRYTLLQVVVPPPPIGLGDGIVVPASPQLGSFSELKRLASDHLKSIADKLRAAGFTVDIAVVVASDAAEAISEAADHGFDLIAITTHGLSGWKRFLFGSVTDRVKHKTKVPLLVVQPQA